MENFLKISGSGNFLNNSLSSESLDSLGLANSSFVKSPSFGDLVSASSTLTRNPSIGGRSVSSNATLQRSPASAPTLSRSYSPNQRDDILCHSRTIPGVPSKKETEVGSIDPKPVRTFFQFMQFEGGGHHF